MQSMYSCTHLSVLLLAIVPIPSTVTDLAIRCPAFGSVFSPFARPLSLPHTRQNISNWVAPVSSRRLHLVSGIRLAAANGSQLAPTFSTAVFNRDVARCSKIEASVHICTPGNSNAFKSAQFPLVNHRERASYNAPSSAILQRCLDVCKGAPLLSSCFLPPRPPHRHTAKGICRMKIWRKWDGWEVSVRTWMYRTLRVRL